MIDFYEKNHDFYQPYLARRICIEAHAGSYLYVFLSFPSCPVPPPCLTPICASSYEKHILHNYMQSFLPLRTVKGPRGNCFYTEFVEWPYMSRSLREIQAFVYKLYKYKMQFTE